VRFGQPVMSSYTPRRRRGPAAPPASYLDRAEACLARAAAAPDAEARALHAEECTLWLMLARQRKAIEAVVEAYGGEAEPAASRSAGATA
jgi:hypothetical protein